MTRRYSCSHRPLHSVAFIIIISSNSSNKFNSHEFQIKIFHVHWVRTTFQSHGEKVISCTISNNNGWSAWNWMLNDFLRRISEQLNHQAEIGHEMTHFVQMVFNGNGICARYHLILCWFKAIPAKSMTCINRWLRMSTIRQNNRLQESELTYNAHHWSVTKSRKSSRKLCLYSREFHLFNSHIIKKNVQLNTA